MNNKAQKINALLQSLQENSDTLSNLIYGYALAYENNNDTVVIGQGIDALLDEVREQFNNVSELVGAE